MKISIIGAGRVGAATAFSILHSTDADEIALVDIIGDLAKGEALDLEHAAFALGKKTRFVGGGDYSLAKHSDLSVIIAGKPRTPDMTRLQLAQANAGIVRDVVSKLDSDKILVVTNPMDVMTWVAYKASGKLRSKVFGMGGVLDTARYRSLGGKGLVVGEHGDSKALSDASLAQKLIDVNNDVIRLKKGTCYGPAASISVMVDAIVNDTGAVLPCSCVLDGEYGLKGIAIGVPAEVGAKGVRPIEQSLPAAQRKAFLASAEAVRQAISGLQ
jgi:malate dehydrogenase